MLDHAHYAVNMPTHNRWQIRVEGSEIGARLILFEPVRGMAVGQIIVDAFYNDDDTEGLMVMVFDEYKQDAKPLFQFEFDERYIYGGGNGAK